MFSEQPDGERRVAPVFFHSGGERVFERILYQYLSLPIDDWLACKGACPYDVDFRKSIG